MIENKKVENEEKVAEGKKVEEESSSFWSGVLSSPTAKAFLETSFQFLIYIMKKIK